jgi:xylose isomerase
MDVCARGLKAAAALLEDGGLEAARAERYAAWKGSDLLEMDLEAIAARVRADGIDPMPRSGRQERLENLWNRYV